MTKIEKDIDRTTLLNGNEVEVFGAMCRLLDVPEEEMFNPLDVIQSLKAIERLGNDGFATMSELFILFASRFPKVSMPVLIDYIKTSPGRISIKLIAAVINEVVTNIPEGLSYINKNDVINEFSSVLNASDANSDCYKEIISTLYSWALREPIPEIGPALKKFMVQFIPNPAENDYFLQLGIEILTINKQFDLLDQFRHRS